MDLKNYEVQPDNGLFEKIEHRLRVRRMARMAGGVAAACLVVVAVVWMALPTKEADAEVSPAAVAMLQPTATTATADNQAVVAAESADRQPMDVQPSAPATRQEKTPAVASSTERTASVEPSPQQQCESKTVDARQVGRTAVTPVKPLVGSPVNANAAGTPHPVSHPAATTATPADKSKDPSATIVHEDNLMWAPNVIVPNGDVDENRTFKLQFSSAVSDFRIVIFNRGGRQLFQSNDPAFEWDGTYDGSAMPQGAYVWVAKFRDSDGRAHQEKGTVTIIR